MRPVRPVSDVDQPEGGTRVEIHLALLSGQDSALVCCPLLWLQILAQIKARARGIKQVT